MVGTTGEMDLQKVDLMVGTTGEMDLQKVEMMVVMKVVVLADLKV